MNEYVTVEQIRDYEGITPTADDALLRGFCVTASRQFDRWCRRRFYPRTETRYYDHPGDATRLILDDDLLAVTTFTTENTSTTVSSDDYYLMCGGTYNLTPYDRIVFATNGTTTQCSYSGTAQQANAVTATWGYHEDWDNAWSDSQDTTEDDPLSASATTITVNDADGADINAETPRFCVGQTLKIESEYVYVTAVNTTTQVLTVRRGINGTTAASHAQNTTISVYEAMPDIVEAVKELTAYLYKLKESPAFDVEVFPDSGVITVPRGIPIQVQLAVNAYKRRSVR